MAHRETHPSESFSKGPGIPGQRGAGAHMKLVVKCGGRQYRAGQWRKRLTLGRQSRARWNLMLDTIAHSTSPHRGSRRVCRSVKP